MAAGSGLLKLGYKRSLQTERVLLNKPSIHNSFLGSNQSALILLRKQQSRAFAFVPSSLFVASPLPSSNEFCLGMMYKPPNSFRKASYHIHSGNSEPSIQTCACKGGLQEKLQRNPGLITDTDYRSGQTLLHHASGHAKLVEYLLYSQASSMLKLEKRDDYGRTPLHMAATFGCSGAARLLLDRDAFVNAKELDGMTPLHLAVCNIPLQTYEASSSIVETLLEFNANCGIKNHEGKLPIECISQLRPDRDKLRKLLEDAMSKNLHGYAQAGDLSGLQKKLEEDPSLLNRTAAMSETPLHVAAGNNHVEMVKFLLEQEKIRLKVKNSDGETPLHVAAKNGCSEAARLLLEHGACVEAKANDEGTPLHRACFHTAMRDNDDASSIVETILDFKPDCKVKDKLGKSPLDILSEHDGEEKFSELLVGNLTGTMEYWTVGCKPRNKYVVF